MRIEPGSSFTRFLSSLVTIASIVALGFIGWKAFDVWRSDPAVKGIEQILQPKQ